MQRTEKEALKVLTYYKEHDICNNINRMGLGFILKEFYSFSLTERIKHEINYLGSLNQPGK